MTKEDLINSVLDVSSKSVLKDIFNEFFESHVCIPKGENRHPYADVLHEWIEGAEMQSGSSDRDFIDYGISCIDSFQFKYHIKPSEPVYEWQYLITTMFEANENKLSKFITDDEFTKAPRSRSEGWLKIEETKRVRT